MGIVGLIGLLFVFAVIFGPQFWVKRALARHSINRPDLQGTGGELAQHLIERFGISNAGVEVTDKGDHYDPGDLMVRLLQNNHDGKSITAVAVAAHEIGHAIQHFEGNRMLALRQVLVKFVSVTDTFAAVFFFFAPVLGVIVKSPVAFFGLVLLGIALLSIRLIVHLVTLPVEWDASFNKALPILEQGNYLHPNDLPAAREVLRAAALTYVSAALSGLLNLTQWIRILR